MICALSVWNAGVILSIVMQLSNQNAFLFEVSV